MNCFEEEPVGVTIPELLLAAHGGQHDDVRRLLRAGVSPNVMDRFGMTPLMAAAMGGHIELARMLVEAGALLEPHNSWGMTALDLARWNGYAEISALLQDAALHQGHDEKKWETES